MFSRLRTIVFIAISIAVNPVAAQSTDEDNSWWWDDGWWNDGLIESKQGEISSRFVCSWKTWAG
jgi:L-alanine-DL-glutamate epimerase-like enolase superfamily enzyme